MIRNKRQEDTRALCDLYTPLSDHDKAVIAKVGELGMGPLEPNAKARQPYDSLYLKQKASRDYWSRN